MKIRFILFRLFLGFGLITAVAVLGVVVLVIASMVSQANKEARMRARARHNLDEIERAIRQYHANEGADNAPRTDAQPED